MAVNVKIIVLLIGDMHCPAHPGARLKQDFINAAMPLIETQMLYAGYRLAYVLNTIFK